MISIGCCIKGAVIPKWENQTKVRPVGDTTPAGTPVVPFARKDPAQFLAENSPTTCDGANPAGTGSDGGGACGPWLLVGDLNGVISQAIKDGTEDINACAEDDATHKKIDHNCYVKNGTVDRTVRKLLGGLWHLAQKNHHGIRGIKDRNDPHIASGVNFTAGLVSTGGTGFGALIYSDDAGTYPAAAQNHYRTIAQEVSGEYHSGTDYAFSASGNSTVNRYSGIESRTGSHSTDFFPGGFGGSIGRDYLWAYVQKDWNSFMADFIVFKTAPVIPDASTAYYASPSAGVYQLWTGQTPDKLMEEISIDFGGTCSRTTNTLDGLIFSSGYVESLSVTNTTADYSIAFSSPSFDQSGVASIALSDAYTAAQLYSDWKDASFAFDMSNRNLTGLRTDEELANVHAAFFDEVGPHAPTPVFDATMDDYSLAQDADDYLGRSVGDAGYEPTWHKRAWIDPADYYWKSPSGGIAGVPDIAGGNILVTPLRSGDIISATQAGSERHFWFGFRRLERVPQVISGSATGLYVWRTPANDAHGAKSDELLPEVAMRWQDKFAAQYDALAFTNEAVVPPGNMPQGWLRNRNSVLIGGKYCEAALPWLAVNYGRPCGPDKYAVDQRTVCCIISGSAGSGFLVKKTGDAVAPLATVDDVVGLAVDEYIVAEGGGIYKITGITDHGDGTFTVAVGAKLDDLPTGYEFRDPDLYDDGSSHIGRLRWPSTSGICGRAAITTSFASGTVTIEASLALPYLRLDPVTGNILVDLYDAAMANKIQATLTRVDDSHFTFTHAAIPTHVWMTGRDVDWTLYTASSKRTGVHLVWTFDQRMQAAAAAVQTAIDTSNPNASAIQAAYVSLFGSYPPTWYAGVPGCTGCTVDQFTYDAGACRAMIGIVPEGSPEDFGNQVLFGFPESFPIDDVVGTAWQSAIELTMPDPFEQQPFKPDCAIDPESSPPETLLWNEDDGTGQEDSNETTGGGAIIHHAFYPHHKLVEASSIPAHALPDGVTLHFDPDYHKIAPPYYPNGIPIGDDSGNFGTDWKPWGFVLRTCSNIADFGRFAAIYQSFTPCQSIP